MPLRGRTNADRALHVLCMSVAFWVRGGPSASLRVRFLCEQFFAAPPQEEVIQGAAARIIVTTSDAQHAWDRGHNHRQCEAAKPNMFELSPAHPRDHNMISNILHIVRILKRSLALHFEA